MSPKSTPPPRQTELEKNAAARRERVRLEQQHKSRRSRVRNGGIIATIVAIGIVLVVVLLGSSNGPSKPTPIATHPFTPGHEATMSTTNGPWSIPSKAAPYIAAAGLNALSHEVTNFHYHAHLDVFVNGQHVTVPALVGFVIAGSVETALSSLHTHDTSGIIHIESATDTPYVLGQFLTEWGVRLARGELGGLVDGGGKSLRVYVDGKLFSGDPATIRLKKHDEIVLWYGPTSQTPAVPTSYQFPANL